MFGLYLQYLNMSIGSGGNNCKVRNTEYLLITGQFFQMFCNSAGNLSADTGIYFVKYQGIRFIGGSQTVFSASMTRESSPPDAILLSGLTGSPGLVLIKNSTESNP